MNTIYSDFVKLLAAKGYVVGSTLIRSDGVVETLVYKSDSAATQYVEWFVHDNDQDFIKRVRTWAKI